MIMQKNHLLLLLCLLGVVALLEASARSFFIRNALGYCGYFCIAAVVMGSYLKLKIVPEQIKIFVDRNRLFLILFCALELTYQKFYNIGVVLTSAPTIYYIASTLLIATGWILVAYIFFKYVIRRT